MLVLVSRDEDLSQQLLSRARAEKRDLQWLRRKEALSRCTKESPFRLVLLDLNVGEEILDFLRAFREGPCQPVIIAFLDHFVGDLPIRAKLAGADRVISHGQLKREFSRILREYSS